MESIVGGVGLLRRKIALYILMVLIIVFTSGCVKGEITLDIGRSGSAELSTKVLVLSFLRDNLAPLKDKFAQDQFEVMDIKETGMEGFHATRKFSNISKMKDISIFKGLNIQENLSRVPTTSKESGKQDVNKESSGVTAAKSVKEPVLLVEKGLIWDKYKINANVDLGSKYNSSGDENPLVKRILSQIDLKFIVKLPVKSTKTNATQVSEDGRTLVWQLSLGENNQVVAEAEMLNLVNVGGILGVLLCLGGFGWYKYRRTKN